MTLYTLVVYAFLSSQAVTDSDRMAAQFNQPTLALAEAGPNRAPVDLAENYTQIIPCDPDNCGKLPDDR